ncbi:class I SAM-dependent DNA methyltransferase [Telluria aromaticivorans]|uniref:class I SAM-dependent DNA methyltransferase n=1 Tax=Telluria aromaticivorans TaxID=2725995 RepID=UPI003530B8D7
MSHLPGSRIAQAYDALAERWLDHSFDPANGMQQHRRALSFLEQKPGAWALNVGCGCNTRFNAPMRERGLEIEGIDISAQMVALARQADPAVVLHHADACDWQPARAYRFITAWDSIWHVPLAAQRPLMLKLMGALEDGGVMIFSAGGLDEPDEHVDAAMGPEVCYSTLGIPGLLATIADAGCVCRHLEYDQHPEQHVFLVVQRLPVAGA